MAVLAVPPPTRRSRRRRLATRTPVRHSGVVSILAARNARPASAARASTAAVDPEPIGGIHPSGRPAQPPISDDLAGRSICHIGLEQLSRERHHLNPLRIVQRPRLSVWVNA